MAITTDPSSLPRTADNIRIQAPSKFQMEDATGTTIKSPKTVADTEIDLLTPANATALVLSPVGADLRLSITDAGTAAAPYRVFKDGTTTAVPVSNVAAVYLLRDAAISVTLHFHYEMIG